MVTKQQMDQIIKTGSLAKSKSIAKWDPTLDRIEELTADMYADVDELKGLLDKWADVVNSVVTAPENFDYNDMTYDEYMGVIDSMKIKTSQLKSLMSEMRRDSIIINGF